MSQVPHHPGALHSRAHLKNCVHHYRRDLDIQIIAVPHKCPLYQSKTPLPAHITSSYAVS